MTAVQVPADVLEFWATTAAIQAEGHPSRAILTQLAASIRAVLPQPAPTCPNCGHPDNRHDDENTEGCTHVAGDPATTYDVVCSCPFPARVLGDLRALIAAERDAKRGGDR